MKPMDQLYLKARNREDSEVFRHRKFLHLASMKGLLVLFQQHEEATKSQQVQPQPERGF